jgi:hypothetical protein
MLVDKLTVIDAAATGFDLEAVRPGPGEPIIMTVINDSVVNDGVVTGDIGALDMAVTHGDDQAAAEGGLDTLITVEVLAGIVQEFRLPASTKRWVAITALPANAVVAVSMEGVQTNL